MIPGWLVAVLAALPSALLVWGGIAAVLAVAGAGVLAVYYLPLPRPVVVLAVLRTAADLARMGAGLIAAAVANRVWIRRLRSMDAYDAKDFSGKGIPRKDWAVFLDKLADLLREMQGSGKRQP